MQIQDPRQVELALLGRDLGQITTPRHVRPLRWGEVPVHRVRCLPGGAVRPGGRPPAVPAPGHQLLLGHHLGDGVHADPVAQLLQVRGDPRRPVRAVVLGEQVVDLRDQHRPVFASKRAITASPLVEPGLRHTQRTACGTPCSALWDTINAATLTAPSLPSPRGRPSV